MKRRALLGRRHSADTVKFAPGVKRVDYSIDQYNEKLLPDSVRQRADELKTEIIAGKIVVPDYYKK